MPNLLGSNPNQVGTNADHGSMAFQDENAVNIGGGLVQADLTGNSWNQNTDISTVQPTLRLDFDKMFALDPRITFGRSGSPATYYDGKTFALAEQNGLLWSQDWTQSAWGKTTVAVVGGSTMAPDGTLTATKIYANTTTAYHNTQQSYNFLSGTTYAISIYVKAAEYTLFKISDMTSGLFSANFDLAGVSATTIVGTGSAITSIGNGWYRCSLTFVSSGASSSVCIGGYPSGATLNSYGAQYVGDNTSGVFIWGAQLEQRSAVSAYIPTTSAAITNYIPQLMTAAANQARFDFDPITGECKGLLVEEQRTNLFQRADDFANAYWAKSNLTVTGETVIAPDGNLTGDKLIPTGGTYFASIYSSAVTVVASTNYTLSVFAKYAGAQFVQLATDGASSSSYANFDLLNGVVSGGSNVSASISYWGNGWYRCTMTFANAGGNTSHNSYFAPCDSGSATRAASNAWGGSWRGIYLWGAQLEAGSFATSYIPTTSGQVTRTADTAAISGTAFSQWFNQGEGTIVVESNTPSLGDFNILTLSDGSISNTIYIKPLTTSTGASALGVYSNLIAQLNAGAYTYGALAKIALSYSSKGMSLSKDGGAVVTATVNQLPPMTRLVIGASGAGNAQIFNGTIKRLAYFPKRLTNAELVEMAA